MAEPTIQLGGGNWAGKSGNLLGYYEQNKKFYAEDFTFSRSTTGTYTDSDCYIQEMPYNLSTNSQPTSGVGFQTGVVFQQTDVYDWNGVYYGDNTVRRIAFFPNTTIVGQTYTFSIFVKLTDGSTPSVGNSATDDFRMFNGTATTDSLTITDLGNGIFRCSVVRTATSTTTNVAIEKQTYNSAKTFEVSGYQLNKGSSAKTYFPTTTRLNMPRVDYLNNSNGSLILEPQSTNTLTYSEAFSQWSNVSTVTLTSGQLAPDGTLGATKISGTLGLSSIYLPSSTSTTATRSIYARTVSGTGTARLTSYYSNTNNLFTLTEEWQRFELTGSSSTGATNFYIDFRDTSQTLNEFIIWGGQSEELSYATSYIPTSGSSVTRNHDVCSITNVADRIGQTEGTLYGEFDFKDHSIGTRRLLCLTDGTSSNRITTYINTLDKLSVYIVNGGAAQADIQATVLTEGIIKYAVAYANNNIKLYLNGTQVGTDTSATIPSTSDFLVGFEHSGSSSYFNWRNCQIYSTALSDSELATLTTL